MEVGLVEAERYKIGVVSALARLFSDGIPASVDTLELRFLGRSATLIFDRADVVWWISRRTSNPVQPEGEDATTSPPGSCPQQEDFDAGFLRQCGISTAGRDASENGNSKKSRNRGTR
jgi:hypothetical protein